MPPYWSPFAPVKTKLRPSFGWVGNNTNGPGVRTKKLVNHFGNYHINPSLVYAQSAWSIDRIVSITRKAKSKNTPIIFNQNGFYYPAWYTGDWRWANAKILEAHERSARVIFQSNFCMEAMEDLTGLAASDGLVIHNGVGIPPVQPIRRQSDRPVLWFSSVYYQNSDHILFPLLSAMEVLAAELKEESPVLKFAGYFHKSARDANWFAIAKEKIGKLIDKRTCILVGRYAPDELPGLTKDVMLAIHLTSKDACPNAVLERMAQGIGHVYADSGGTPELVGDSGIGVRSTADWNKYNSVDVDELVEAIKCGIKEWQLLSGRAYIRAKINFSWDGYVSHHQKLFNDVTG